jgi:hypothetical protein
LLETAGEALAAGQAPRRPSFSPLLGAKAKSDRHASESEFSTDFLTAANENTRARSVGSNEINVTPAIASACRNARNVVMSFNRTLTNSGSPCFSRNRSAKSMSVKIGTKSVLPSWVKTMNPWPL